jgi:hypothetical protein
MREKIAGLLSIDAGMVGLKGKTTSAWADRQGRRYRGARRRSHGQGLK